MNFKVLKLIILSVVIIGLNTKSITAQNDSTKTVKNKTFSYSFLPILLADPFIGFGYGALTNFNFLLGSKETTRYSNAQAYVINTTNNQFAVQVNHQLFTNGEKYIIQGKLQYLNWPEYTYGLGANTNKNIDNDKNDLVKYKAIELEERVLYKLKKYNFLGLQYRLYNCWNITSDTTMFFEKNAIGKTNFIASGVGIHYIFDSRDNVQNAYNGKFLEVAINPYNKFLGSTQNWLNIRIDARTYYQFKTSKDLIFANRIIAEQAIGDVPYMIMPQTGRLFSTRGYAQGRYRGKLFLAYETELRANIWKFIGGVAFAGVSTLTETDNTIKYLNPSYGAGLRFNINKLQRTNIRVDYARGINDNSGLYFQITEVF